MFNNHAIAVASFVDEMIRNLDRLDAFERRLQEIGSRHAHMGLSPSGAMHPRQLDCLAAAFIDCTLEWGEKSRRSEETRKAWAMIATYIVDRVKMGFNEERKLLLKARHSMSRQ